MYTAYQRVWLHYDHAGRDDFFPCDVCKLPDARESKRFEVLTPEPCMAAYGLHAATTHKNRLQVSGIDALQTPLETMPACARFQPAH